MNKKPIDNKNNRDLSPNIKIDQKIYSEPENLNFNRFSENNKLQKFEKKEKEPLTIKDYMNLYGNAVKMMKF